MGGTNGKDLMIKEFRDFIAKGNVMDLAVGIIIGAAFTAIVNSMVNDLINPVIGAIIGGLDFSGLYVVLRGTVADGTSLAAARESGAAVFAYGSFLSAVINFLIIAWVVFLLVKAVNKLKAATAKQEAEAAAYIQDHMTKPVIAYIAGLTAPKGRTMGHAGAIISAFGESASEKVEILTAAGVTVAENPSVIGETVARVMAKRAA